MCVFFIKVDSSEWYSSADLIYVLRWVYVPLVSNCHRAIIPRLNDTNYSELSFSLYVPCTTVLLLFIIFCFHATDVTCINNMGLLTM